MAKMALNLAQPVSCPGDTVRGEAVLRTEKPLKVRKITVQASGAERTDINEVRGKGKNRRTVTYTEVNPILHWDALLCPAGVLPPGEHRFPFEFQLPPGALPSYEGNHARVAYKVTANADIPMWFDAGESVDHPVRVPRLKCRMDPSPRDFATTDFDDPSKPGFMAQVLRSTSFAGDPVEGSVTLMSDGGHRVRKATVTLDRLETAAAHGRTRETRIEVAKVEIPGDLLGPKRTTPFSIFIPKDTPVSYNGRYSTLKYFITVKLDVALAFDVKAAQEIVVFNAD